MTPFLAKIASVILAPFILIAGIFSPVPITERVTSVETQIQQIVAEQRIQDAQIDETLGLAIPSVVAVFETSLASSLSAAGTSMTLVSGTTKDGTTLSGSYGFVIDEGTASEEFVTATCTNTSCTSVA